MLYRISAIALLVTAIVAGVSFNPTPTNAQTDDAPTSFVVRIENISDTGRTSASGVFNTPVDASEAGPVLPGGAYEFSFVGAEGERVSFATMFVQSNDLFFAANPHGIDLFDEEGNATTGDITSLISLWDAGTEVNEAPGEGANQPPRQADANTGESENGVVHVIEDGMEYPAVSELISATLDYDGELFTLRIDNISGDSALASPLAPGFYAVHSAGHALFDRGQADRGEGLEALAEDGNPAGLAEKFSTTLASPFAPGVAVVHTDANVLFTTGEADRGAGLEGLAEDGNPAGLAELDYMGVVSSSIFNTPEMMSEPGPLLPGSYYEFTVDGVAGDYLSLATMLVQSNDLFIAGNGAGMALFDADGNPVYGEIAVSLWDAGTEVNEAPGEGANQPPRQVDANTGETEDGVVQIVNDGFSYPATFNLVRITIYPADMDMMGDHMDDDMMGDDSMSDDDMMDDDDMGDSSEE